MSKYLSVLFFLSIPFLLQAQSDNIASGSGNGFSVSYPGNIGTSIPSGMELTFRSNQNITGSTTLTLNGINGGAILKNFNQVLVAGDIMSGHYVRVIFDGTNFQMLSSSANVSSSPWVTSGSNIYYQGSNVNNGFVGIGLTNPAEPLHLKYYPTVNGSPIIGTLFDFDYGSLTNGNNQGLNVAFKSRPSSNATNKGVEINSAFTMPSNLSNAFGLSIVTDATGNGQNSVVVGVKSDLTGNTNITTGTKIGYYTFVENNALTNIGIRAHAAGATNNYAAIFDEGLVGIGTLSPISQLDVVGNTRLTGPLTLSGLAGGIANLGITTNGQVITVPSSITQWINTTSGIYYNSGNVGIGTSFDPTQGKLVIVEDAGVKPGIFVSGGGSTKSTSIFLGRASVPDGGIGIAGAASLFSGISTPGDMVMRSENNDIILSSKSAAGKIRFATGLVDTEKMLILGNGNVGIANSLPNEKLTVQGNSSITGTSFTQNLQINALTNGILSVNGLGQVILGNTPASQWISASSNQIYTNSLVGIGMANPNALLQFPNINSNRKIVLHQDFNNDFQNYGLGIATGTLYYSVGSTAASHGFYAGTSATTSVELMRIQGNGNVGIGTTSPNERLAVQGNASVAGIGYFGTIIGNNLAGFAGSIVTVDGLGKLGLGGSITPNSWLSTIAGVSYTSNSIAIGTGTVAGAAKLKVQGDGSMGGMLVASQGFTNLVATSSNLSYVTLVSVPVFIPVGTNSLRANFIGNHSASNAGTFRLKFGGSSLPGTVSTIGLVPALIGGAFSINVASIAGTWTMMEIEAQSGAVGESVVLTGYSVVVKD